MFFLSDVGYSFLCLLLKSVELVVFLALSTFFIFAGILMSVKNGMSYCFSFTIDLACEKLRLVTSPVLF